MGGKAVPNPSPKWTGNNLKYVHLNTNNGDFGRFSKGFNLFDKNACNLKIKYLVSFQLIFLKLFPLYFEYKLPPLKNVAYHAF